MMKSTENLAVSEEQGERFHQDQKEYKEGLRESEIQAYWWTTDGCWSQIQLRYLVNVFQLHLSNKYMYFFKIQFLLSECFCFVYFSAPLSEKSRGEKRITNS